MKRSIVVILCLLLLGCYNKFEEETVHWFIEKGSWHGRLSNQAILQKHTIHKYGNEPMTFNAVFGDGCDYDMTSVTTGKWTGWHNKDFTNKLNGFSLGTKWRTWSARIGWMYDVENEVMRIYGYSWINGVRDITYITSVDLWEYNDYIIEATPEGYYYSCNGVELFVEGDITPVINKQRWRLYVYFGGDPPAPNDMRLFINEY